MSARDTALSVLIACRRNGAWSDAALKQQLAKDRLDRRDAALATRLCASVLQNRLLLDEWISRYLKGKLSALQPVVLDVLRLAVCQLRFFDKLPPSAVVDEAVNQTKRLANPRAAGLVNGLLRAMLRDPSRLTLPEDLFIRYSHPRELVELLRENLGEEDLEALLACHNQAPAVYAQVNTLRTDGATLAAAFRAEGMEAEPHPWLPDCLLLSGGGVEQSAAFREGLFYVQDPAARLAVLALDPKPGDRVLDCCAAPGGKSFAAAIAMQQGRDHCLRHPPPQAFPDHGRGGTAGDLRPQRPGSGRVQAESRMGREIRPDHRRRALLRSGGHPEKAGYPLQGACSDGAAAGAAAPDPGGPGLPSAPGRDPCVFHLYDPASGKRSRGGGLSPRPPGILPGGDGAARPWADRRRPEDAFTLQRGNRRFLLCKTDQTK